METRILTSVTGLPIEIFETKMRHFQEIFGASWLKVYALSPLLYQDEEVLVVENQGRLAGWTHFQKNVYNLKFRNFVVHPDFRGQGVAKLLLQNLHSIGAAHHQKQLQAVLKPSDIGLMFLQSLVYFDRPEDGEVFAFGKFLKKAGFTAHPYNKQVLTPEETAAIEYYKTRYPEFADSLRVFKQKIVDDGVILKPETQAELLRLSAAERAVVMRGLDWKIGHYDKSGRISYRYDLCPICAHVGSSEQDSANCKKCPIHQTCFEPFREMGRFKEDSEISSAYFRAVRDFIMANGGSNEQK